MAMVALVYRICVGESGVRCCGAGVRVCVYVCVGRDARLVIYGVVVDWVR